MSKKRGPRHCVFFASLSSFPRAVRAAHSPRNWAFRGLNNMPATNDLRPDSPSYFALLERPHAAALKETHKAAITSARWFRTQFLIDYNWSLVSMGLCNNSEQRGSGRFYA